MKAFFKILTISLLNLVAYGQQDSTFISGKIENLNIRLYRQADVVQIVRVNILSGRKEIVTNAPLNADGSFNSKLALAFPKEECFLAYGPWIYSPFLAEAGQMSITIFADSLNKSDIPFLFGGLNAQTNNRRAKYDVELSKYIKNDNDFQKIVKKNISSQSQIVTLSEKKKTFFRAFQQGQVIDTLLNKWVEGSIDAATQTALIEIQENIAIKPHISFEQPYLLTFSKVELVKSHFEKYLETTSVSTNSLKINKLAEILLTHVDSLTASERQRLTEIKETNTVKQKELQFVNDIFKRKADELTLFTNYELALRQAEPLTTDFGKDLVKTMLLAYACQKCYLKNIEQLYGHLSPQIQDAIVKQSFDQWYHLEVADSAAINAAKNIASVYENSKVFGRNLEKVYPEIYFYNNIQNFDYQLFSQIKEEYNGQPVYFVMWNMNNIQNQRVPDDLANMLAANRYKIIYICESKVEEQLWKEQIIKHKLKGIHIRCADGVQDDFWANKMMPTYGYCAIYDEKMKLKRIETPYPRDYNGWQKVLNAKK